MPGFQKVVNTYASKAYPGMVATNNPWIGYVAGEGALVAGPNGVTIARFGWATPIAGSDTGERVDSNASLVAAGKSRAPSGFVHNELQGTFTTYLQESGMQILPWSAMEIATRGDFWALNVGPNAVAREDKVFTNMADGTITTGAAGSTVAGKAYTASFATNVMTVTVAPTGGVVLAVGDAVVGTGVPANTYIASFGTGTGGTGTYNLTTTPGTIAAQATTSSAWVETKFRALSVGASQELFKIGFGD